MLDFKLDDDGDLCLDEHGELAMIDGAAEVAQAAGILLLSQEGEYFLDRRFGIDWVNKVLTKPYRQLSAERHVKSKLLGVFELSSVTSLRMPAPTDSRTLPADIEILSIHGPEVVNPS